MKDFIQTVIALIAAAFSAPVGQSKNFERLKWRSAGFYLCAATNAKGRFKPNRLQRFIRAV